MSASQLLGLSLAFDGCVCERRQTRKAQDWTFSRTLGQIWTHRKHIIPPKLQAFSYRKASPFPGSNTVCKVVVFASSLIFIMLLSCALLSFCPAPLTIALRGLWIQSQGVGENRHHSAQSSARVAFFCMHVPFFFFFFFPFSSSMRFLSSAQDLYQYPPTHSHFTGFHKSSRLPAYTAKKSIFLDSPIAVLISTPCSICCWVMQRGRWAALICPETQRGVRVCQAFFVRWLPKSSLTPASCTTI